MILIIDDHDDICEILSIYLKKEGYKIEKASTGNEGIAKFKKIKPNLVFLDIRLPDIDGIEVLKEIKKNDSKTPIIIITAYREAEKVVQAFRLGAYDCIFKPFDFNYIKTTVLSSIGKGK